VTEEQDPAQLQAEINALKRQMRQLLEVVAVMQEHANTPARDAQRVQPPREERGEPTRAPAEQGPTPAQAAGRTNGPTQDELGPGSRAGNPALPAAGNPVLPAAGNPASPQARERQQLATEAAVAPVFAENARLVDLVRTQAEEIGILRERVRRLEEGREQGRDSLATSLRSLLQALGERA
jgi:hypothetical protein